MNQDDVIVENTGRFLLVSRLSGRAIGVTYVNLPEVEGFPVFSKLAETVTELQLFNLLLDRLSEEAEFFVALDHLVTDPWVKKQVGVLDYVPYWVGFSEEEFAGNNAQGSCRVAEAQGAVAEVQIRKLVLHRCLEAA